MTEDGGPRSGRTAVEDAFLTALLDGRPWFDVWLHEDDDSTTMVCVSHDFSEHGSIRDTLRLDFDGSAMLGGWSPANLNWDDGVRATAAGIESMARTVYGGRDPSSTSPMLQRPGSTDTAWRAEPAMCRNPLPP